MNFAEGMKTLAAIQVPGKHLTTYNHFSQVIWYKSADSFLFFPSAIFLWNTLLAVFNGSVYRG